MALYRWEYYQCSSTWNGCSFFSDRRYREEPRRQLNQDPFSVDSGGLPVYFEFSQGQVNDIVHAKSLIKNSPKAEHVVADKGYDSDTFREKIEKWEQIQQSQEGRARRKVIRMLIGAYIDTDIWLRMHSVELKIIEQ